MEHGHGSSPFNVAPPPSCHPVLNSQKYKVTPLFLSPCSGNKPISISSITTHRCWKGFSFRFAYRTEPDEHLTKFRYRLLRIKQLEQQDLSDTLGVWEVKNNKRHFQRGGKVKRIYAPRSASFRRSQRVKWMLDDTSAVFFYLVPFATILEGGGVVLSFFYKYIFLLLMYISKNVARQAPPPPNHTTFLSLFFQRGVWKRNRPAWHTHTRESVFSLPRASVSYTSTSLSPIYDPKREKEAAGCALSLGSFSKCLGKFVERQVFSF